MVGPHIARHRPRTFWLPWVTLAVGVWLQTGEVRGWGIPAMTGDQGALPPGQGGVIPGYHVDGPQRNQARPTENLGEVTGQTRSRDVNVAPKFHTLPPSVSQSWRPPTSRSLPTTPQAPSPLELPTPFTRTLPPLLGPQGLPYPSGIDKGGGSPAPTDIGHRTKTKPGDEHQAMGEARSPSPPGLRGDEGVGERPSTGSTRTSPAIPTWSSSKGQATRGEPTRPAIAGEGNRNPGGGEAEFGVSARTTLAHAPTLPLVTTPRSRESEGPFLQEPHASTTTKPIDERGGNGMHPPDIAGSLTSPRRPWKPWPTHPASGMIRGGAGRAPTSRGDRVTELPPDLAVTSPSHSQEGSIEEMSRRFLTPTPAAPFPTERQNPSSSIKENATHAVVEVDQHRASIENEHQGHVTMENVTDVTDLLEPQRNAVEGGSGSGAEGNQTEGGGEGGPEGLMVQATKTSKDDVHKATTIAAVAPAAGMENSKLEMGTDYISGIFPTMDILRPTATVRDSMLASESHQSAVDVEESSRIFSPFHSGPSVQATTSDVFSSRTETSEVTVLDSSLGRTMIPEPEQTPSLWITATTLQTSMDNHRSASNETIAASVSLPPSVEWSLMMEKMLSDKLLGKSRKPASESDSPETASHRDTFTLSNLFSDFAMSSSNSLEISGGRMHLSSISEVVPTHLTDNQSLEVTRSRRDVSSSLTISPTSTRSYREEVSTEHLHSETVSHLGVPDSRVVVEPSLSLGGESFAVMPSSTFAGVETTSLGVSRALSEATPSYSTSGFSSAGQTQVTVSSISRTPGETDITSTSSATTSGAVLPTGDHEIVLHNSTSTTTPSSADTTSGPSTTGTQHTTTTSHSGNSPSDSGASTSTGGAARHKITTSLPPTSDTPPLPPSDNSSLVAENATDGGGDEHKDRPGKSPKPPGQEGSTPGSDMGPRVTTETPGANETDHGNSTSSSGPAVLSSSSSSSSLSSESMQSGWVSSAFHQGSLSNTSPLSERVTASSSLGDLAGETYRSVVNPLGTLYVQGTSTPGILYTHSRFFSNEIILASAAEPTPSLPERTTQGFHTFSSGTTSGHTQSSSVEVEATVTAMTLETNSVFDSSVVSSEPATTESPVWAQNETSPADNATTPSVRTLPNPLTPTSPSSSPSSSPTTSSLLTSPTPVSSSSPVNPKQTTVEPSSSTTIPLPRTPWGFISTRRPPVTTSTFNPSSNTTPPPVFLRVKLQMSWSQFCQLQETFREELSRVLRGSTVYTATINRTQIVLMNARVEQCLERLLLPEPEQEEITIQVYFVDATGRYDGRLTITSVSLIKAGFSLQDASFFKDRLLDVRLSTDTERTRGEGGSQAGAGNNGSLFPEPGTTIVAVIGTIGGVCCVALVILQVALIRRRYGRTVRVYVPGSRHYGSAHSDSIALASVTKCRPHSGLYNPTFNAADLDLTHPINAAGLARVCQDTELIQEEFQSIPNETPPLTSVPAGAEDKNRYANVIPIPETRVKLRRRLSQPASDYINANYITGHKEDSRAYIATQAPLEGTTADLWRMVWEQQCRAILMLTPMDPRGKPQVGQVYWPESEAAIQRYGDFRVALKKRDVTQEYIHSILELKEIESNLVREVQHFWLTCWPMQECPQPLAMVKFVLDTRPSYEDSGAPVVVMCSAGTGRSGVFVATDICMRQFEARRVVDILNCVYRLRRERAGMVQTRDQYTLVYQALHEYASVMTAPGHHAV